MVLERNMLITSMFLSNTIHHAPPARLHRVYLRRKRKFWEPDTRLRTEIDVSKLHDGCGQEQEVFHLGRTGLNSDAMIQEDVWGILCNELLSLDIILGARGLVGRGPGCLQQGIYLRV